MQTSLEKSLLNKNVIEITFFFKINKFVKIIFFQIICKNHFLEWKLKIKL